MGKNREQLNEQAEGLGIDPKNYDTKADLIAAIQAVEQAQNQPPGIHVTVNEDGTYNTQVLGGIGLFAAPTHLRRAANEAEGALTKVG